MKKKSRTNGRLGYRKPEGVRIQRQIRAYDDEWELIKKICRIIKHGDRKKVEEFFREDEI